VLRNRDDVPPPLDFEVPALTGEEIKWVRQQKIDDEHRRWFSATLKKIGVMFTATVAGFGGTLGMILALREFLRWLGFVK